jgi:hypothetical protein
MLADSEMVEEMTYGEVEYYLLTNREKAALGSIKYPIKSIFIIDSDRSLPRAYPEEFSQCFFIYAQTVNGIRNRILQLLQDLDNGKEKALFIDHAIPVGLEARIALYRLLSQKFGHVYFMGSLEEAEDSSKIFREVSADENSVLLFDKPPDFENVPWEEKLPTFVESK